MGGWRGWPCSCHPRRVSPKKPQDWEVAPLPAEMSHAGRRWRRLWDSTFLPSFSLKANFCHKARGGFIPSVPTPPMFGSCNHEDPSCFLGLGTLKAPAPPLPHWLLMDQPPAAEPEKPARELLTSDAKGVNRTKSPPRTKVLAGCFLEKPSQNKADIENIRLSMRL